MDFRALKHLLAAALAASTLLAPLTGVQAAAARIKDIVDIEGVRDNQLVGYGLVVGLNGTGDSLNNSPFTRQSLQAMLERLGVNTRGENMRTGQRRRRDGDRQPAGLRHPGLAGSTSMSRRSAMPTSLQGGTLLVTPLLGADGEVYAIAQGSVTINGFKAEGDAATDHFRRADHRPHFGRRPDRARDRLRARRAAHAAPGAAQPRPHHLAPRRARRSTTSSASPTARRPRIRRPSASTCPTTSTATSSTC